MKAALTFLCLILCAVSLRKWHDRHIPIDSTTSSQGSSKIFEAKAHTVVETYFIKPKSNLHQTLMTAGLESAFAREVIRLVQPLTDLSKLASETAVLVRKEPENGHIEDIEVIINKIKTIWIAKRAQDRSWAASVKEKTVHTTPVTVTGTIESSFWDSAVKSSLTPAVISKLAEVFSSQLDFERHFQPGDSWKIVIEKKDAEGQFLEYGDVLGAFFWVKQELYSAIAFPSESGQMTYYNLRGESLAGIFLKSPLNYTRISSPFQKNRFHPVLGINRPHKGVDYAAARGTPVRTVGDGRVTFLGKNGGAGNMIEIQHDGIYKTAYKHLDGFVKGLKKGDRVRQGQLIGYVGMTGLASGPHLHFEFYEKNQYRDPLGLRFPKRTLLIGQKLKNFQEVAKDYARMLKDDRAES